MEGNKREVTFVANPQVTQTWVAWVLLCAAAMLLLGVSALTFALGYARGLSQIPEDISPVAGPAETETGKATQDEFADLPEKDDDPKVWFDAKNEAHMKDVEIFSRRMAAAIENHRAPESLTQELVDFLDFDVLFGPSPYGDKELPIDDELIRYRLNFCDAGQFINNKYYRWDYWSIVARRCLPPHYVYRGVSPAFSLYWSEQGCKDRDYEYSEYFSDSMCIELQEIQFERIEALSSFLSNPDRLWHIYNLTKERLKAFIDQMSPEERASILKRITSAIASADTVLNNCTDALCAIPEPDFSVSEGPMDTHSFVGVSPIENLIDYDMLLASEIYEVEFFVRRYNEGGRAFVTAYRDILQEVAAIASEQPE
jgi:hypothetical protein